MLREIIEGLNEYKFKTLVYLSIDKDSGSAMGKYAYKQLEEYVEVLDWFSEDDNHYVLLFVTENKWAEKLIIKTGVKTYDVKYKPLGKTLSTGLDDEGSPIMDTNDFYKWADKAKTK